MKATYGEINGVGQEIFKDPVTDDGTKKSKKGLLKVFRSGVTKELKCIDQCNWEEEEDSMLQTVFKNGELVIETTLEDIRNRLNATT